ncbi:MAG: hypothetical protein SNJ78_05140 [Spirochaetales bacterium]
MLWLLAFLLTLSIQFLPAEPPVEEKAFERFLYHRKNLLKIGVRKEGSREEAEAFSYLTKVFKDLPFPFRMQDFSNMQSGHSFSQIAYVTIQGQSDNLVLLSLPFSEEDSPTGVDGIALALTLVETYRETPPPSSLQVVFLGGDTGKGEGIGSQLFLQTFHPPPSTLLLYLKLSHLASKILLETGTPGLLSPALPIDLGLKAFQGSGIPVGVLSSRTLLFRLNINHPPTPLRPFLQNGIPALGILSAPSLSYADDEEIKNRFVPLYKGFVLFLHQFGAMDFSTKPLEWDTHYEVFQIQNTTYMLGETWMVGILLGFVSFGTLVAFLRKKQTLRYIRTMIHNFWDLPLLFIFLLLFLYLGTGLVQLLEDLRYPLWEYTPFHHFIFKLSSSTFFFSLFFHLIHRLPLSKRGSFYSAASILFFFLNVIIFSFIDISLSYYFLWGFLCSFGFSFFRNKGLKLLFLLIAPFWLYKLTYDVFSDPEYPLVRLLLKSFAGNVFLAFMLLPLLLMIIRLDFLVRHPSSKKAGWGIKSVISLSAILSVGIGVYLLLFEPFKNNPIPVNIEKTIDLVSSKHIVSLKAKAPLAEGLYLFEPYVLPIPNPTTQMDIQLPLPEDPLTISFHKESFLDRTRYFFTLNSDSPIEEIYWLMEFNRETAPYGANFPLTRGVQQTRMHIGRNPTLPLRVTITVPKHASFSIDLEVRATLQTLPNFGKEYVILNPKYRLRKRLELGSP